MKKNIDAMNHPTKVKESIGERIYTIVVYLLLILILMFKPQGLFGKKVVKKV